MAANQITPRVRQFIQERINSLAQLELLLLLRTNPAERRAALQLSEQMGVEQKWVRAQLQIMREQGLVSKSDDSEPLWRYEAATAELDHTVADVAQAYLLQRNSIIELIYSPATAAIRAFSEAFRLKGESRDG